MIQFKVGDKIKLKKKLSNQIILGFELMGFKKNKEYEICSIDGIFIHLKDINWGTNTDWFEHIASIGFIIE